MGEDEAGAILPAVGGSGQPASTLPQYIFTILATLIVFSGGTSIGWTSPALPELMSNGTTSVLITPEQGSWVGSLLTVGAFVGALPAGPIADIIGRKLLIHSLGVPMIISWMMKIFATNVWMLYISRFIAGMALGASCAAVPTYIGEIAQDSIRGSLCSYFQLMLVAGILYTYIVGTALSYKLFCLMCGLIPVIFLVVFFAAPESPVYLIQKHRRTEAEMTLKKLRGPMYNISSEIRAMQAARDEKPRGEASSMTESLCSRAAIRALVISLGLMFFQQLSGINVVIFYMTSIFEDAGSTLNPGLATIIVGIVQVVATFVSILLIDRAGRKILLMISGAVMAVCLSALGWYFKLKNRGEDVSELGLVPLVALLVYISVFAIGFGPVPWLMAGEVLPADIKGIGTSIAVATNWALAFTVTKTFQDLLDLIGPAGTYYLFALVCGSSVAFVFTLVIETKGKSYSKVQEELSSSWRPAF